jgi:hypothetical protein
MAEAFDIPASVVGETRHPTNKQHNTMGREYILKMWPECSKRALRFGMENPEDDESDPRWLVAFINSSVMLVARQLASLTYFVSAGVMFHICIRTFHASPSRT